MSQLRGTPSSMLSSFCNGFYRRYPDFHFLDGDLVLFVHDAVPIVFARSTRILRLVETKRVGEQLTRSQRETLPIFASLFELGVREGVVRPGSGVFVVEGEGPEYPSGGTISQIRPDRPGAEWSAIGAQSELTTVIGHEQLVDFMRCRWTP